MTARALRTDVGEGVETRSADNPADTIERLTIEGHIGELYEYLGALAADIIAQGDQSEGNVAALTNIHAQRQKVARLLPPDDPRHL